ncbi:hypothetical protein BDN71DRAFT_1400934, partial [Pleurotus eryngii]
VLQRSNHMTIKELLNPVAEEQNRSDTSEEEIFKAVQEMWAAVAMMEINGRDDGDDEEVVEKPSCKEALMAASTLGNNIADIDNPFACKLKALLGSFEHQTQLEAVRATSRWLTAQA